MPPAKRPKPSKKAAKKTAKTARKAAPAKARKTAKKAAKPSKKTARRAAPRPAKSPRVPAGSAAAPRTVCIALDPFGDPCQNTPRLGSKYCGVHSHLG
jgi:hypothetical protein